jgi:transcription-repair coupling factor (superfamily II helicase)
VGRDVLLGGVVTLEAGAEIDPRSAQRLIYLGYKRVPMVEDVGDFSRRGGILTSTRPPRRTPSARKSTRT